MGLGAAGTAAAIGAAGSIGGATIGALANRKGATGPTVSSSSSTEPWGPQQPYLKDIMGRARDLYYQQQSEGRPSFQLYAPLNDQQKTALALANGQSYNMLTAGNGVLSQGQTALGGLPAAQGGLLNFANGNFNQGNTAPLNAAGGNVPGSLDMANRGILTALDPNNQYSADRALAAGASYAGSAPVQGLIDQGVNRISQGLTDVTLPGQTAAASATGNLNSTRSAVAEALARRNAAQTASDLTAQVNNNAFNTGVGSYLTGTQANTAANLGGANAATSLTNTGLAGANASNALNLSNLQLQQAGLSGLLSSANLGAGLVGQGASLGTGAVQMAGAAGGVQQQDAQNQLDASRLQWEAASNFPWDLLGKYASLTMIPNLGKNQSGTQTSSEPPNPWGGALGGALSGLGIANSLTGGDSGGPGSGSLSSGLASVPGIGYGLGYLNSPIGDPAIGTETLTPYWRGLMARG